MFYASDCNAVLLFGCIHIYEQCDGGEKHGVTALRPNFLSTKVAKAIYAAIEVNSAAPPREVNHAENNRSARPTADNTAGGHQ
jgi:hypothetical protein